MWSAIMILSCFPSQIKWEKIDWGFKPGIPIIFSLTMLFHSWSVFAIIEISLTRSLCFYLDWKAALPTALFIHWTGTSPVKLSWFSEGFQNNMATECFPTGPCLHHIYSTDFCFSTALVQQSRDRVLNRTRTFLLLFLVYHT